MFVKHNTEMDIRSINSLYLNTIFLQSQKILNSMDSYHINVQ